MAYLECRQLMQHKQDKNVDRGELCRFGSDLDGP